MNQEISANTTAAPAQKRQSNIELLRIITMIMIVAHHFSVHGNFDFPINTVTINRLWIQFIQIGGKIGVDVFVLISGYFLITADSLKINKVIKMWIQIFTYSVLIYVLFVVLRLTPFSVKDLVKSALPITYDRWWFASGYFVLYLLSPFINKAIRSFDRTTYLQMLALMTFCWCIVPTFLYETWECNDLLWFIYLYLISGYIRLHAKESTITGRTYLLVSGFLILLTFGSAVVFDFLGLRLPFFGMNATFFYEMHQIPIVLISITMFLGFSKIKMPYIPAINLISATTFGVYLIHDNSYVRPFLWRHIFRNAAFAEDRLLIPYSIVVVLLVFIVCSLIELIRIHVLEKQYMKLIDWLCVTLSREGSSQTPGYVKSMTALYNRFHQQ